MAKSQLALFIDEIKADDALMRRVLAAEKATKKESDKLTGALRKVAREYDQEDREAGGFRHLCQYCLAEKC